MPPNLKVIGKFAQFIFNTMLKKRYGDELFDVYPPSPE